MNIVHLFKDTNKKFYKPYIEFINEKFDSKEHHFIIEKYKKYSSIDFIGKNVEYVNLFQYLKLISGLHKCDKIILHSLMSPRLVIILFLQPWLLRKCYWVVWGADLYYYLDREKNIRSNINEYLRKKVIKNIGNIVTYIKGDFELAKKWYGARGEYYYSIMYPSNLYKEYKFTSNKGKNKKVCIQIGNSADPSNNHIEVLEKLQKYTKQNIEIECPLSYGNKEYASQVINFGTKLFGSKFNPMIEFMPFEEYLNLLSKVDIAIFNHKRQQGMGNIITLLGLGKKVYMRNDIVTWNLCTTLGLKVFNVESMDDLFIEMSKEDSDRNIEIIKLNFSETKLKNDWEIIFNS